MKKEFWWVLGLSKNLNICVGNNLLIERQNVDSIVFAGAEPVLVSLSHFGTEFLVQFLARTGAGVAVDSLEVLRYPADESGLQNRAISLALILAQDRVRVAVDSFRIARKADEIVLAIPWHAIG